MYDNNKISSLGCARSPIQSGSSRYWELGSLKDKNVCIGGIGPIQLGSNYKMAGIIDYSNKVSEFCEEKISIEKAQQLTLCNQ